MANEDKVAQLATRRASDVLRDTDRKSVGLVRVLSGSAGTAGDVREYEEGDEALVEAGQAEWVVAPVHAPESGRRLDTDQEREALPRAGIEAFPPADGDPKREAEARKKGYVEAHSADGLGERLAGKRAKAEKDSARDDDAADVKRQAELGSLSARSGPVTSRGDLTPEELAGEDSAAHPAADTRSPAEKEQAKKAAPARKAS